ncbi:MAG: 1-acyl-sn-glycerol-3-phosphate acyltransferase [Anaerolineaceae bacterium]|nr:1-acyl-sn-glycerol-3-phosphate acyltransferase [Anaerolineaceae bacterium]
MKKETLQRIVRFFINTFTISEFHGIENVPKTGGVILAINHVNYMDTPLLMSNPVRPDITALITTKYMKKPFIAWFTKTAGGIWINRDIADFTAIRTASKALAKGIALGIAPEGTRSKSGQMQEGKPGTVLLAVKSGAPVIPTAITGTGTALNDLAHFRRPRMTVRFGKPLIIPSLKPGSRSKDLKRWTYELMLRIAELLPESYRGIYQGHLPRE